MPNPCRRADADQPVPSTYDSCGGKPSADRVLSLLEAVLQEQISLCSVLQRHQQILLQKLDDLQLSSASSTGESPLASLLSKVVAEQHLDATEVGDLGEEAQKWFKNTDRDQCATLPKDELKTCLNLWVMSAKPVFKDRLQLKSEEDVDRFLAEFDASGDGMVGEQEFKKKLKMIRGGMVDGKFEAPQKVRTSLSSVGQQRTLMERIVSSRSFDITMSLVILANLTSMSVGLQLKGLSQGWKLGVREGEGYVDWPAQKHVFDVTEKLFSATFLLEFSMRLWAHGCRFLKQPTNVADAFIVGITFLASFVPQPTHIRFINVSVLRLFRIARCVRLVKILRFSKALSELRVMIDTLHQSIRAVFWAMVLLGAMIAAGAIIMTQITIVILDDPNVDIDTRIWLYTYFGTVAVSMHSMFECTFSGRWWFYTRPLIEDINYSFAAFWLPWVVLVNFAAIRVVGAIFLKQTMNASVADAEKCAMTHWKHKGELSESLRLMFEAVDTSGDGAIAQDEFDVMMSNEAVVATFAQMGLGVEQMSAFFSVLASDDGQVDYDEFVHGALAMATSSPTLDNLKTLQNRLKMNEDVANILKCVQPFKQLLPILATSE